MTRQVGRAPARRAPPEAGWVPSPVRQPPSDRATGLPCRRRARRAARTFSLRSPSALRDGPGRRWLEVRDERHGAGDRAERSAGPDLRQLGQPARRPGAAGGGRSGGRARDLRRPAAGACGLVAPASDLAARQAVHPAARPGDRVLRLRDLPHARDRCGGAPAQRGGGAAFATSSRWPTSGSGRWTISCAWSRSTRRRPHPWWRSPGGARAWQPAVGRATMPGRGTGPSSPAESRFAAFASISATMPAPSVTSRSAASRSSIATAVSAAIAARARTSPRRSPREAASAHLAQFDPLTDLPNRAQLCEAVDHAAALARDPGPAGGAACASISTAFARSTTRSGPRSAICCSRPAPGVSRRASPRATAWRASAATSSRSCRSAKISPRARRCWRAACWRASAEPFDLERPGGDRERQHRRRPDRGRPVERRGDQERRHRALSCQARGARHLLRVRAGHGGAAAPAPRARVGPQARPGGGRVPAGLSAADRCRARGPSSASRRWSAGCIPSAACWRPRTSSRRPTRPG